MDLGQDQGVFLEGGREARPLQHLSDESLLPTQEVAALLAVAAVDLTVGAEVEVVATMDGRATQNVDAPMDHIRDLDLHLDILAEVQADLPLVLQQPQTVPIVQVRTNNLRHINNSSLPIRISRLYHHLVILMHHHLLRQATKAPGLHRRRRWEVVREAGFPIQACCLR